MNTKENLQAWLLATISGLVSDPSQIEIKKEIDEMGTRFFVKVGKEDTGKVIGKKGAVAQALRTITRSAGFLADIKATMVVEAPEYKGTHYEPKE